jgi:hypothetical protein
MGAALRQGRGRGAEREDASRGGRGTGAESCPQIAQTFGLAGASVWSA